MIDYQFNPRKARIQLQGQVSTSMFHIDPFRFYVTYQPCAPVDLSSTRPALRALSVIRRPSFRFLPPTLTSRGTFPAITARYRIHKQHSLHFSPKSSHLSAAQETAASRRSAAESEF